MELIVCLLGIVLLLGLLFLIVSIRIRNISYREYLKRKNVCGSGK
jgi:hypothetical protein